MKEVLSKKNITFDYVEITDNMKNLKEFLKLRDKRDEFAIVRRLHSVGIPCLLVEGEIILNITDEVIESLCES